MAAPFGCMWPVLKRGQEAMIAAGILPTFAGCTVHDHWVPYCGFERVRHSLCNAPILRELRYFEEATNGHHWPIRLREILIDGKRAVEAARAADQTAADPERLADILARYNQWVRLGLHACRNDVPGGSGIKKPPQVLAEVGRLGRLL